MTDDVEEIFERLAGVTVEPAAIEWVMAYERRQGRNPVDRRHDRAFPGDIESAPRVIEVKAAAKGYRGSFLWLEAIQHRHAIDDRTFHIYVVENVGQGNPAKFTLRVLAGEHLQRLAERAKERRYFEMSWPTKDYDATRVENMADFKTPPVAVPAVSVPAGRQRSSRRRAATQRVAVREAMVALGGEATISEVDRWIADAYGGRSKTAATVMADSTYPGNKSSTVPLEQRFLERVGPGRYRLRD